MKTRCCSRCGVVLTGRNHCQSCGQPDYDQMSGVLDRRVLALRELLVRASPFEVSRPLTLLSLGPSTLLKPFDTTTGRK